MNYELIIIGAGPAGLTAALYAGRFRLKTLLLEKMAPGGQILLSATIENYPGFPGGIPTYELIKRFNAQVEELGIKIKNEEALEIKPGTESAKPVFEIKTQCQSYQTKSVIIASGAQPKRLGVKQEDKFIGKGVSYCGTCDGPLFKDKDICVIGGGNRAVEEALFLAGYAKKVFLVHRRAELRAAKILTEKAMANPKISFVLDSVVEEILGQGSVEGVLLKNVKAEALSKIHCQGVFIFVGIEPNTAFAKDILQLDAEGFINTDRQMQTSCPGIFACGDCCKKSLYQVVNACADGAIAADSAHKYNMDL